MATHRKLAAILSADAVGYSRLMAIDEDRTVDLLNFARVIFRQHIQSHSGRLIDTAGDSVLAEFPSVVEALRCASEVQEALRKDGESTPDDQRMQFRISINLGDVIEQEDGTIYGDGVNVAARLQALAEPGGICISGQVFDHVDGKISMAFKFIGEQQVKNIVKPVRAYRSIVGAATGTARTLRVRSKRRLAIGMAAIVAVLAAAGVAWNMQQSGLAPATFTSDTSFAVPTGPSMAVLPFRNVSGDPKEDYFSDGLTEDIITILSKFSQISVIAWTSASQYKGRNVDVRVIGNELGVRYVLEGSVRRSLDAVRINAQLIDTTTGNHIWAERYDRPLKDIFALQDEITQKIVTELDVNLLAGEQARAWRRSTLNLAAYDHHLRGYDHLSRLTREDQILAQQYFEKAVSIDPKFAHAYAKLGFVHLMNVVLGFSDVASQELDRALSLAKRAIALNESEATAYVLLGRIHLQKKQHDQALAYGKKALALEPGGAAILGVYGHILEASGQPQEALFQLRRAMRLAPVPEPWWPWLEALCLSQLGRSDEAITAMKRSIALSPGALYPHVFQVSIYATAGREAEALAEAREVLKLNPAFSVNIFLAGFDIYRDRTMIPAYAANLRKAGLR